MGVLLWRGEAAASHGCLRRREGNPKTQVPTPNLGHPPRFSVTGKLSSRGFRSTAQDAHSGRPFQATPPISFSGRVSRLLDGDLGALLAGAGEALDALVNHRAHSLEDRDARIPELLSHCRRNHENREHLVQSFAAE